MKLKTKTFSIIIPTYNSKNYINNCLNSITNNCDDDLEIIIVDDASTDNTIIICENFKKINNNIRIFKLKKNRGPGYCRNLGIKKSKGKYIALHFLLKTECPYCIRHTSEYFDNASTLKNVIQVFIKPDSEKEIKEWANKLKSANSLPIYQDADAKLADQFNIPNGYQFHGQVVHYPALILINEQGNEVFRYIGKNNSDRYSFEQLKAKIEALTSSK